MNTPVTKIDARELFAGIDCEVPLLDGRSRPYVNLDNAATTSPLKSVVDHVASCSYWYSSVHRGTGFKSLLSTHAHHCCRNRVAQFVGADPDYHTIIFCSNTTDAVNRLCSSFSQKDKPLILTTVMEHHSNMLPWRFHGRVEHVQVKMPSGALDLDHLEEMLQKHHGEVSLVAVTGASNITGLIPPLKRIARLAHEHGALLLVDAAQLIAHRPIKMGSEDDPERIDFLAFSGHKMYAPFGSGALIAPRKYIEDGPPGLKGGGAVDLVTLDEVQWTALPDKEEAGSPNLLGICAMAKAMDVLDDIGMDCVEEHDHKLMNLAFEKLRQIDGVQIYGACSDDDEHQRLGVIPFLVDNYEHGLLAAILGYEWGIGVRNGCFCAHPYLEALLGIGDEEIQQYLTNMSQGDYSGMPGFVRISMGLSNNEDDLEYLAEALNSIVKNGPRGQYKLDKGTGDYAPRDFSYDFDTLMQQSK